MVIDRAGRTKRNRLLQAAILLLSVVAAWLNGSPVRAAAPHVSTSILATPPTAEVTTTRPSHPKDDIRYQRWRVTLTWTLVILIAFVTAAAAIVTFSRGFRRWLGREPKTPTASDDVWAMHKPPENVPDLDDDDATDRN